MRRTAVGIILAGFLFIFVRLSFLGIDILIDAVGFLLIFNGARALQKIGRAQTDGLLKPGATPVQEPAPLPATFGFGAAQGCAIALVFVSALQLFLTGVPLTVLGILRAALEIALFAFLLRGFGPLARQERLRTPGRAAQLALALDMAASALSVLHLFFTPPSALWVFTNAVHIFTLAAFLWLLLKLEGSRRKRT